MGEELELKEILVAQKKILDLLERMETADPDRPPTFGEKAADAVVRFVGSWKFVILQASLLVGYISLNAWWLTTGRWDPYPFILLNLILSFQAAFTAPLILIAQNRAGQCDRRRAIDAYRTITHIEGMMEDLSKKIEKSKNGNGKPPA